MKKLTLPAARLPAGKLHDAALTALRPSVEAVLIVSAALGCAQAGWSLLTPPSAVASGSPRAPMAPTDTAVRSPFAASAATTANNAAAALLANLRLAGVRMAADPALSGAYIVTESGKERPFLVGQEVTGGLRLKLVAVDHVVISYDGGESRIALTRPDGAGGSYARALMGLGPAVEAASAQANGVSANAPAVVSATSVTEAERAWVTQTLARVEKSEVGDVVGWRVAGPIPQRLAAAGLRDNDLIMASALPVLTAISNGQPLVGMVPIERAGAQTAINIADAVAAAQASGAPDTSGETEPTL